MHTKIKKLIAPLVMILVFCAGIGFAGAQSTTVELEGYAWSDNIGWISMNCKTGGPTAGDICGVSNYKVSVSTAGALTGYGWSDNIGWVKFGGLSGIPSGGTNARYDSVSGKITGFARFCAGMSGSNYFSINNNCSGSSRTDGWDGWVSLSSSFGPVYGITVATNGLFSGYAWGDEVVGWIDFSAVRLSSSTVNPSENVFLDVGAIPPGALTPTYTPANLTTIPITPVTSPFTIQIAVTQGLYYKWNTAGATSCAIQGASNFPVQASMLQTGSSGAGVMLPVGTHYIAIVCQMASGNTMIKSGTVNVVGVGVWINFDPNAVNTATQATLTYYSVGVQANSCRAYSLDSNNYPVAATFPGTSTSIPVGTPPLGPFGIGPGTQESDPASYVSALLGSTSGNPQTPDWNPVNTVLQTVGGGQVGGTKVINREPSSARYYIECINPLNGNVIHSSINSSTFEVIPMDLTAYKNGVPVTQVNQGDTVDLEYKPQNMGYTFSSCLGSAMNIANAQSVTVPNWNGPIIPSYTPLNSTTPSSILGVATVLPAGSDIQYKVGCVTPWGAVATGTADVNIRGAIGGLVLNATPNSFLENTSGQTTTLSWSHPTPLIFPAKACHAGDATSPTGLKINGVSANASSWTTAVGSLGSPNSSKPNVQVHSLPAGSVVEYSITCIDISSVSHVARTNIVYTRPVQTGIIPVMAGQCIPDDINPTDFEISWWSDPTETDRCYSDNPLANTFTPLSILPPESLSPPYSPGAATGSFTIPYIVVPSAGLTFRVKCYDNDGNLAATQGEVTVYPNCTSVTGSVGPKKPRFEEF